VIIGNAPSVAMRFDARAGDDDLLQSLVAIRGRGLGRSAEVGGQTGDEQATNQGFECVHDGDSRACQNGNIIAEPGAAST
jgi:hypothetical protein